MATTAKDLPLDRVTSSIPRTDTQGNWMYPSQQQLYNALSRKNHNPREADMKFVVPIHNAVNERTWMQIMEWENGQGGERCGGAKLATFRGRPNDTSPKAWCKALLGCVICLIVVLCSVLFIIMEFILRLLATRSRLTGMTV